MRKSIIKKVVSIVLAVAMSLSIAVGVSTTANAAAKTPGKLYLSCDSYDSRKGTLTISWNKPANTTAFWVEVTRPSINSSTQKEDLDIVKGTSYKTTSTSASFTNVFNKCDIAITPLNGDIAGEKVHLYDCNDFFSKIVPYIPNVRGFNYTCGGSDKTGLTFNMTWKDRDTVSDIHSRHGYRITLTDLTDKTQKVKETSSLSCKFSGVKLGHKYRVSFQSYVIGYAGKHIYDIDVVNYTGVYWHVLGALGI